MKRRGKHIKLKITLASWVTAIILMCGSSCQQQPDNHYDVIVYGGSAAGVAAAIQAQRMGKQALLIVPKGRIGGLTTGGLGQTDIGNKRVIGGIAREFYNNIWRYYQNPAHWQWQQASDYKPKKNTRSEAGERTMWVFEPSAALKVLTDMAHVADIAMARGERLDRENGVEMADGKIKAVTMLSGQRYTGAMFIDATYEGDLMAAAGVPYALGREAVREYGETLNGVQAAQYGIAIKGDSCKNAVNHNFVDGVDPYRVAGDASSGLVPFVAAQGPGAAGEGDHRIQAYCYRMCLTDHPDNRIPFAKPDGYNAAQYELLFRNYEAGFEGVPWINSPMPNRKTDTNNKNGFSTDFIGQNYRYPEASYQEREAIAAAHKAYQQGLMWTLANHPRIPEGVRNKVSQWGTCKDEFEAADGWQQQLYVREARRMKGELLMTQQHCEGLSVAPNSVGMAAYGMDSHHTQRYVDDNGQVKNEGNVQAKTHAPYPVGYEAVIPKSQDCVNLLVPVCLSATHIAFGSIRMEPVFMVLAQSAATAACIAIDRGVGVQEVEYTQLKHALLRDGQVLQDPLKGNVQ